LLLDRHPERLYDQQLLERFREMALSLETPLRWGERRGGPRFIRLEGDGLMKNLKIATATAIVVLIAAVAMAAEEGRPKGKDKGPKLSLIAQTMLRIDRLKSAVEGLDLSENQKEKLGKVRDDFEAKRQAIYEKLADLLTEDQKQIGKDAMESAKQSGKMGREVYQSLEASLKLTDEQKQKMEPIGKEFQSLVNDAMKQVTEVLTPEQKEKLQQKMGPGKKGKKGEKKEEK
jgi:Spy/CpxP family protein refolding chaperone